MILRYIFPTLPISIAKMIGIGQLLYPTVIFGTNFTIHHREGFIKPDKFNVMNLNYGYDKQTLTDLVDSAAMNLDEHNIVIDFDGEVVLDPEIHFPDVPLSSYLFASRIKHESLKHGTMVTALYDALEKIFNAITEQPKFSINAKDQSIKIAA